MELMLTSTTKIVQVNGVPARIWEGVSAAGIPCHAYITRVAVANEEDTRQFEEELQECRAPTSEVAALPASVLLCP
jgi:hypothetical protein